MNYNLRQLLKISPCCGKKPIIRKSNNYTTFACSKCYCNFPEKWMIYGVMFRFKFYEKYYLIQKIRRYSEYSFLNYKNYTAIDFKSAKEVIDYYRKVERNICFE